MKLDLTDTKQTTAFIQRIKPRVLIHAAAQRFPDKVEEDYEAAQRLNVESTKVIAQHMRECSPRFTLCNYDTNVLLLP